MTFATPDDRTRFESHPLVSRLDVVRESRFQALSLDTAVALQAPNVVAVEWLIEQLRPTLETIGAEWTFATAIEAADPDLVGSA